VAAAAEALGISQEAVRMQINRGTLQSERAGGHVYVILNAEQTRPTSDHGQDLTADPLGELVEELRDRLRFVERQLEAERQAHAEARRIIGGLVQRIPELEPPSSQDPSQDPSQEPSEMDGGTLRVRHGGRETPFTAEARPRSPADEQQGRGPIPDAGAPQEAAQPRSWWRRMFGG
jgi:hypothetical protein